MKKQPSRAPSPTPTAFSGISNYRTDSYRPINTRGAPAVPTIDYRQISKTHYAELGKYLAAYLAAAPANSRSNARSKLTRLTIQQFHELSTDVYDELIRRNKENEVPFLPVREEFHPKRNQARQKLATLPTSRFEDLSSDVFFELARRYPEFKEDPSGGQGSTTDTYDDFPAPDYGSTTTNGVQRSNTNSRASGRVSSDRERPPDSGYGGSISGRKPSIDSRRRPSEDLNGIAAGRRSEDTYRRPDDVYSTRSGEESLASALASRRKPSQDIGGPGRKSDERDREREYRRPGQAMSVASESTVSAAPAQSATATSAVIIPNKSTMEEEYIDIPYGREARESGMTTIEDRAGDTSREMAGDSEPPDSASDYAIPMNSRSPPAGLMGLSARLKGVEDDEENAPGNRSTDDLYDKYGRSSVDSARSAAGVNGRMYSGRASVNEDTNKIRRDYEYKIATMQSQINSMQRELNDAAENERRRKESEERVRQLDEELAGFREQFEQQSMTMISIQKELEDVKEARQREARQAKEDHEELSILRDRCHKLEEDHEQRMQSGDPDMVEQLRNDMESLISEISELSRRNDELMTAKDSDNALIREMDSQLKEYKRKYELAKTELRSVKATSQLFLQAPKFDKSDDQLPVAADGAILDIHVTAFLSAIDSLLTAGRSNAPTRVLSPMKSVVNAVTNIIDNVKSFEQRSPRDRPPTVDIYAVRELRDRAEVTLSNLVTATKNHAAGSGMSPVSLLDAAASHVSGTIAELGKMVYIRKATKAEQEQYSYTTYAGPSTTATGGFTPSLRSVEETRSYGHQRKGSGASVSSRGTSRYADSQAPSSPPQNPNQGRAFIIDPRRRPPSENSSSEQTSSPPPIFDSNGNPGGVVSDDSAQAEAPEDAWAELKPYLEAQTDEIVKAIQKVLSGVRTPAPSPMLNDNLTQIITIVSSIVAVCNDNFPPAGATQGMEILHELSDHANKLSEVQSLPEVTKDSRQIMAKSSFAIANAMKGLMKL